MVIPLAWSSRQGYNLLVNLGLSRNLLLRQGSTIVFVPQGLQLHNFVKLHSESFSTLAEHCFDIGTALIDTLQLWNGDAEHILIRVRLAIVVKATHHLVPYIHSCVVSAREL